MNTDSSPATFYPEVYMKLTDFDVVVVGAGLAGFSCARHLMNCNVSFSFLKPMIESAAV